MSLVKSIIEIELSIRNELLNTNKGMSRMRMKRNRKLKQRRVILIVVK